MNLTRQLFEACGSGDLCRVKELVEDEKADVNARDKDNYTPLTTAARKGHISIVKYLIEKCAVSIDQKGYNDSTALCSAACNNHLKVLKFLHERKADVNARNENKYFPLAVAAFQGHIGIVKYLIEKCDVIIDQKSNFNSTALEFAFYKGNFEIIKILIDGDAEIDFDIPDKDKRPVAKYLKKELYKQRVKQIARGFILPNDSSLYRCSTNILFDINVIKYCVLPFLES